VMNHFKSKGSLSSNCDPAGGGLQGNCNDLRVRQAQGVLDLIEDAGLEHVAVLGDLNAYSLEEPIGVFEGAGFTSPADRLDDDDRFSYVFDGQLGELDHALVDSDLAPLVTGVDIWHINSIEPPAKDYTAFNDIALYEPNEYRSSDHDPLLFGLDLTPLDVDGAVIVQKPGGGGALALSAHVDAASTTCPTLALDVEGTRVFSGPTIRLPRTTICVSLSTTGLVAFDLRTGSIAAALTLPSSFRLVDATVEFDLSVGGVSYAARCAGRRAGPIWTT